MVCIGDVITFTVSGVVDSGGEQRTECTPMSIVPVEPSYEWDMTRPIPLGPVSGLGDVATSTAEMPGDYSVTFTATANRDCPPIAINIGSGTTVGATTVTLTVDPSSIPATTEWEDMPDYSYSQVTVEWDPPECEGTLDIVEVEPLEGYLPPSDGALTPDAENGQLWYYTAFDEPQTEKCSKEVKVWIAAKRGDMELLRKSILVWAVHVWLATVQADFQTDYDYITWKYASVLATTGGTFSSVTISPASQVQCGGVSGYACTNVLTGAVTFGTSTFSGSENQAASIIGHELVHASGVFSECTAFRWEAEHCDGTGVCPCDAGVGQYLENVLEYLRTHSCP